MIDGKLALQLDLNRALDALSFEIHQYLNDQGTDDPIMIGIQTGGVWIAQALHQRLNLSSTLGELNIAYYRDDFDQRGLKGSKAPSNIPHELNGKTVILIDDVYMTGRTARAAMNELFDYGRPKSIAFFTLINLHQQELPIQPKYSPIHVSLDEGQSLKVTSPAPLKLTLFERS
ncbi:MAG: bifunctional pyr operon transcriptional regulator/uracil phosphoribosyltransferase PyrR [Pseudomonadota bacterium]|nr:bifunctional pyr operon transcriptional regulator/uracil phosphoribosyltransferase PyrR [Pseudomonadota bacterium]